MWRAIFSAIGIMLLILGVECLLLDHAVLHNGPIAKEPTDVAYYMDDGFDLLDAATSVTGHRNFAPPDWAPWSLLSSGSVVLLYAFASRSGARS